MLKVEPFRQKGSSMVLWHREAGTGGGGTIFQIIQK